MISQVEHCDTQQIWTEFADRLRAFIARRLGSTTDAEDILHDGFLRIHRHADSLQRRERLVSWLFQITRNAIADFYRAPVRRELLADAPQDLERDAEQTLRWTEGRDETSADAARIGNLPGADGGAIAVALPGSGDAGRSGGNAAKRGGYSCRPLALRYEIPCPTGPAGP